ncbi:hypothetical protein Tcan_14486 [Toxocara canis]|uniref:Tudor domain-containing protein n=1 Tax=Toxocara canis TaxID=6265 RepID=A0A0B2V6R9_TOXCA|nr:hypothetical protein Tcan_14486 [Toxocara canis]
MSLTSKLSAGRTSGTDRALWVSRVGKNMSLMARMATETVGLKVPLCEPFMARVMRVDVDLCRICVSPISASLCRKTLETSLNVLSSTNQTYDRPVDITSGFVYLIVGAESNRGVPFRGVIMKEQPAAHYAARVFDVDSGKVMPVGSKDIVQLPACLRNVPPLVICIATPPAAVDCTSSEYISERSIVQCKINPEDLLMCVEGAYPPVLICEVRKEQDAPVSGLTAVGCQPKIMGTEAVTRDEAKRMIEQRKEALRQGERTIAEGMSKLQKERELFEAAKIKFGGQDDECESVKSVENSNSVLNRGLIVSELDGSNGNRDGRTEGAIVRTVHGSCDACRCGLMPHLCFSNQCVAVSENVGNLVERPQQHQSDVFDVDSGKVMPVGSKDIVQLPACLRNVPPLVICIATPPAAVDCTSSEYISERSIVQCKINPEDLLMCVEGAYPPVLICEVRKEQDAPVSGLTAVGCQPKIMGTEAVTRDEAKRMIEQRKEALRQGERTIAEGMSKLQKERELFEAAKIKFGGQDDECESVKSVENSNSVLNRGLIVRNRREQELAFMAMQLQIANMSQKVDAIANNSVRDAGVAFGVCIYPPPSGIQLNNAYGQQQQLSQQQANQCLAGGWGEVSGELLARMQQLQVVHQQRGDWSQTVPSYGSVINAAVPSYENTQVQSYGNAENATVPSISSSTNAAVTPYNCVANAAVPSCGIAANAVVPPCGNVRNSAVPSYDNVANLAGHSYGSVTNTAIPSYGNVANLTAPSYHSVANAQAVSALSAPMSTPATQPSEDAHPSPFTPEFKNGGSLAQNASVPQVAEVAADRWGSKQGNANWFGASDAWIKEVVHEESNLQSRSPSKANSSAFGQMQSEMPFASGRLTKSVEHSSTSTGITRAQRSSNRYQYGEPPRHLLSDYDYGNSSKKSNSNGSSVHFNRREFHQRSENVYYNRRYAFAGSLNEGSCTICHGEGHFANNCPSNNEIVLYARRPRDKDGNLLYTSDESTDQEAESESLSENQTEDETRFPDSSVRDAVLAVDANGDSDSGSANLFNVGCIKALKFVPYVKHVDVKDGCECVVKRSDDDHNNVQWPLFFVQVQDEQQLDFIEENFDSLQAQNSLPDDQVVVGTLCASFCRAFEAVFRAVITGVGEDGVEVHYVDYGNYELVDRSLLKSLDDQTEITRTHVAMAIPCILKAMEDTYAKADGEVTDGEVAKMQMDVSCDLEQFTLRFLRQRPDGVHVVEVVLRGKNGDGSLIELINRTSYNVDE